MSFLLTQSFFFFGNGEGESHAQNLGRKVHIKWCFVSSQSTIRRCIVMVQKPIAICRPVAIRCQCGNDGLHFVLVEQVRNTQLSQYWTNKHALHIWQNLSCPVLKAELTDCHSVSESDTQTIISWRVIIIKRNSGTLSRHSPMPRHTLTQFSFCSSAGWAWILWQFDTHSDTSQNNLN